jgi:hypothetical protein
MNTQHDAGQGGRVRVERGVYRQPYGKFAVCFMLEGKPRFRTVDGDLDAARGTREQLAIAAEAGAPACLSAIDVRDGGGALASALRGDGRSWRARGGQYSAGAHRPNPSTPMATSGVPAPGRTCAAEPGSALSRPIREGGQSARRTLTEREGTVSSNSLIHTRTERGRPTVPMELAGLEPAASWVRSRRSPN